jgi:hypothetical protein
MDDCLTVTFDFCPQDDAIIMVMRTNGEGFEVVNGIVGDDAVDIYNKLIGKE